MISLSEEWARLSELVYGNGYAADIAALLRSQDITSEDVVLHAGCGNGYLLHGLADRGFKGIGIDSSEEMIRLAKTQHAHPNINYECRDWRTLTQDHKAGTVLCLHNSLADVISWDDKYDVHQARQAIEESLDIFLRCLRPGGVLYLDTISDDEVMNKGCLVHVHGPSFSMKGRTWHDVQSKTRYTSGQGLLNGEQFNVTSVGYLLTADELENMLHGRANITRVALPSETFYQGLLVQPAPFYGA